MGRGRDVYRFKDQEPDRWALALCRKSLFALTLPSISCITRVLLRTKFGAVQSRDSFLYCACVSEWFVVDICALESMVELSVGVPHEDDG